MKVLLLGSGGREHALALGLLADPAVARESLESSNSGLFVAPGNPGIALLGATNVDLDPVDGAAVSAWARDHEIDLVVVGPEAPLVAGVADDVRAVEIPVFGPSKAAARLEGSKTFAKEVMEAAGVPTGASRTPRTREEVRAALEEFGAPYVVKDDGLAAGKGVVVTSELDEALAHAEACLAKPGGAVVVEEYLDGPEVSLFCLSDGEHVIPLEPAQDFKRALDGDAGPNTGGMGAYSPLPWAPEGLADEVVRTVALPVVREMARRGTPFVGLLYCGLALTSRGVRVIEFNVRFGDPETQVVIPRLKSPLAQTLLAAATGTLAEVGDLSWFDGAAVTVVIASEGYPEAPVTGREIRGLADAHEVPGVHVVHAGTADRDGTLIATGGRVLSVVGMGPDLAAARATAYRGVAEIALDGSHHRSDIARAAANNELQLP